MYVSILVHRKYFSYNILKFKTSFSEKWHSHLGFLYCLFVRNNNTSVEEFLSLFSLIQKKLFCEKWDSSDIINFYSGCMNFLFTTQRKVPTSENSDVKTYMVMPYVLLPTSLK